MRGAAFAAALAAGLMAVASAAEPSVNGKFGLQMTFPEKWIVGSGDGPLVLMSRSTDPVTRANCVAIGEPVPATKGYTQAQLNEELKQPFGAAFWTGIYAKAGMDAKVKADGVRLHPSGVMAQEAWFDLKRAKDAPDATMSFHQSVFVTPGMTFSVGCSARVNAYAKLKPVLAAVIDSVRFVSPSVAAADPVVIPVKDTPPRADALARDAGPGAVQAAESLLDLAK